MGALDPSYCDGRVSGLFCFDYPCVNLLSLCVLPPEYSGDLPDIGGFFCRMSTNTYEALIILKPILDVDNSDSVLKSVEDQIENLKGKVVKKDKLGRKRL